MALFISGLFTGMAVMIALSFYLYNQSKKKAERKQEKQKREIMSAYGINPELLSTYYLKYCVGLTPEDLRFISHSDEIYKKVSIEQRLKDALDREDFEEAARIRDLINKG